MRVQFTDRFVATAKPRAGAQAEHFDSAVKGLALRVGARGKAWNFHYSNPRDGRRARVALGSYPALSLAAARAKAVSMRGYVEDGRDPRELAAAEAAAEMTLADLIESYLIKHVRPNLRSAPAIERRLRKNVLPMIGGVRLAELHRRDISRVIDPILARGRPVEAGRVFEDTRAMLRWAVGRGDLDHAPTEGMRKPSGSKPRERVLSDPEIRTLWHGLPRALRRSKACQRIIRLCLVTGQRVGEVAGMRRDELDLDGRTWRLPGERTKNGTAHDVPLSDFATLIIREALADVGDDAVFVFPAGEGSLPPHAVARTIGRAQDRFGIQQWTAHDLRRTTLTNLAQLGVAPIVAGAVANHLSVTKASITLSVYTRYSYAREKREALDLWAERLGAVLAPAPDAAVIPLRERAHG